MGWFASLREINKLRKSLQIRSFHTSKVHNTNAQEEIQVLSRMFPGQEQGKCSEKEYATLPNQYLADVKDRKTPDESRQLKQNYYVKIAVLIDSEVWN
ncbi:hypothetical protein CHS0354_003946 [Potamilus streckersoni]|uniref:Uncharacterized protein n=1 Tax=Potamilus streckersoni TaxID=2493646 RepID=A0AAE0T8T0_9BIVA|nr:hypothetical protein CHS0354_003946 [Potamilus streckersoni]